jgi:hypothetical protein
MRQSRYVGPGKWFLTGLLSIATGLRTTRAAVPMSHRYGGNRTDVTSVRSDLTAPLPRSARPGERDLPRHQQNQEAERQAVHIGYLRCAQAGTNYTASQEGRLRRSGAPVRRW